MIDISGDGKDNVDNTLLSAMRAAAGEQAVEINGLAIMTPDVPEIDRYYSQQVVNGFVVPVEETDDFQSALKRKLFYEIAGPAPLPAARGDLALHPLILGPMRWLGSEVFAADFATEPVWWADAPPSARRERPLPARSTWR